MTVPGAPTIPAYQGIESLRGRTDPEAIRAAAREMESLFAFEMIKAMRAASGGSATGGEGLGGEVYGTLFDMELAKLLASRGLGLQDLLLKGLGQTEYSKTGKQPVEMPALQPTAAPTTASPLSAGPPSAVSGPHTHEALEESGQAASSPGGGVFPIREGGRVSSAFGLRKDPFTGAAKLHHGIDIAAPEGTSIHPVRGGEVTFSGSQQGYGNVVVVDHGDGFVTKYAHNRANRVAAGDRVETDTVIAEVGSTGRSTGPHLHFEARYEGKKIHPEAVFAGIAKGRG
jgi:murein DD-endopeptidase MepM/ murein hydrolase activator NlpD